MVLVMYEYTSVIFIKIHVVVLTETFPDLEDEWLEIPGNLAHHSLRHKPTGGVGILVDDSMDCDVVNSLVNNNAVLKAFEDFFELSPK